MTQCVYGVLRGVRKLATGSERGGWSCRRGNRVNCCATLASTLEVAGLQARPVVMIAGKIREGAILPEGRRAGAENVMRNAHQILWFSSP